MEVYHKINSIYKRHKDGPRKGKLIVSDWSQPEFEYLANNQWDFTEKVDGCVSPKTNIRMADGSRRKITDVKVGDYVLGHDETGVVASRVEAVKMQPTAGEWVRVRATRTGLGSGNSFGQVVCTHDHKIWTPDRGWVEACMLRPGDKVLSSRTDLRLTPIQEQVLVGKMLGDGSLTYHDSSRTASVEFGHVLEELVDWTLRGLGDLAGNKGTRVSGYCSDIVTGRSKQMSGIYDSFREWIDGGKKVPKSIVMTPIVMAFWYMDDGSLSHNDNQEDRVRLATNGFDDESCNNLLAALERVGIEARVKDYKGNTLVMDSDNAERFFLIVAPYIPTGLQYKLPARYRGHDGWLPTNDSAAYKSIAVEQRVLSVERTLATQRWDIQTETSNFFTVAMLVHNTNIRIQFESTVTGQPTAVLFGGRSDNAVIPESLLQYLKEIFTVERFEAAGLESVTLFGEGYGPKIQGGGKYREDVSFVLFDVKVGDYFLKRDDVNDVAAKLGIDAVPVIGSGTLHEAVEIVSTGITFNSGGGIVRWGRGGLQSQWGDFEAEGIVARPKVNLFDRSGKRIICKIKGKDFK